MSGLSFRALLDDQLADERAKKNSLEQRGIAVISTAGTLVTITLGFVALATRAPTYVLASVVVLLVVALGGLIVAAAAGLLVNLPARLPIVDADELIVVDTEDDGSETARAEHEVLARLLTDLRKVNRRRARLLFAALLVEVSVRAVAVVIALAPMTDWPILSSRTSIAAVTTPEPMPAAARPRGLAQQAPAGQAGFEREVLGKFRSTRSPSRS
jgi:hypothetical protein